jgi:hypothetical protein
MKIPRTNIVVFAISNIIKINTNIRAPATNIKTIVMLKVNFCGY